MKTTEMTARLATMTGTQIARVERLIAEGFGETGIKHETGLTTAQINAVFAKVEADAARVSADAYNGWSNRETWTVNLWLTSNDEATYSAARDLVAGGTEWEAADRLEAFVDEWIEQIGTAQGIVADLLNAALGRCNWREVVRSLRAD